MTITTHHFLCQAGRVGSDQVLRGGGHLPGGLGVVVTSQLGWGGWPGSEPGLVQKSLLLGLVPGQLLVLQVLAVLLFLKYQVGS